MARPDLRDPSLSKDLMENSGPPANNLEGKVRAVRAYSSEFEFDYNLPPNYEHNLPPYTMANDLVGTSSPTPMSPNLLDLEGGEPHIQLRRRSFRAYLVDGLTALSTSINDGLTALSTSINNGLTALFTSIKNGVAALFNTIIYLVDGFPTSLAILCVLILVLIVGAKFSLAWKALDRPPNL